MVGYTIDEGDDRSNMVVIYYIRYRCILSIEYHSRCFIREMGRLKVYYILLAHPDAVNSRGVVLLFPAYLRTFLLPDHLEPGDFQPLTSVWMPSLSRHVSGVRGSLVHGGDAARQSRLHRLRSYIRVPFVSWMSALPRRFDKPWVCSSI